MLGAAALRDFFGLPAPEVAFNYDITPDRVGRLAAIISQPTRYVQRLVEHLSFVPTGGQQWVRTLQIQIPDTSIEKKHDWWIVPLGQFSRKRFADLAVADAQGRRLNLLTRSQHGDALTDVITTKYASQLDPAARAHLAQTRKEEPAESLRSLFFQYLINLDVPSDKWSLDDSQALFRLYKHYEALLLSLGLSPAESRAQAKKSINEFAQEAKTAPYLCWVKASPGEVVSLRVAYSSTDPKHKLPPGGLWDALKSALKGLVPLWSEARAIRGSWFRQYGLAPMDYAFDVPKQASTGSYYLTLQPPAHTTCTYLDWAVDDSFNVEKEVDGAFPAAHIHNDDPQSPDPCALADNGQISVAIRAYLRCAPHHHKQILGATALNVAVVWLLAKGELPIGFGEPLQALIAAAPSILIAFLAQQQRHYYSNVMRRQRAILWIYLFFSVSFLVSVAFSAQTHVVNESGLPWLANIAAWVLAITSAGVFVWHLPLGGSYERMVKYLTDRKWEIVSNVPQDSLGPLRAFGYDLRKQWWRLWRVRFTTKWECYADAVRQYSCIVCILVLVSMSVAAFLLSEFADFELKSEPTRVNHHAVLVSRERVAQMQLLVSGKVQLVHRKQIVTLSVSHRPTTLTSTSSPSW